MPDLDDLFETFTSGTSPAPPALDIRRRGDRLRRRNRALAAAGATVAAVLVAVPLTLVVRGQDGAAPVTPAVRPTTVEEPTRLTRVPDDFPLLAELGEVSDDTGPTVLTRDRDLIVDSVSTACQPGVWRVDDPTPASDVVGTHWALDEWVIIVDRTLAVYPTDADAESAAARVRSLFADCEPDTVGATDTYTELPSGLDDTTTVVQSVEDNENLTVWGVTQVGNAVLLSRFYVGEDSLEEAVSLSRDYAEPVVEAMRVFADD